MFKALASLFRAPAAATGSSKTTQIKTTHGHLIKEEAMSTGFRTSLKKARRALQELAAEGLIDIHPALPGSTRLSPFNRPLVISATPKGLALFAELATQENIKTQLEQKIDLLPGLAADLPGGLPKRSLKASLLPPKAAAILNYLMKTADHFNKTYCYPSQDTILEHCRTWSGESMAKSTLNRWLLYLEAGGWIRRSHRHRRKLDGTWEYRSTLYELCSKVWTWAKKMAAMVRKFVSAPGFPQMGNNPSHQEKVILESREKGAPTASHFSDEDRQRNILSLRSLLAKIG